MGSDSLNGSGDAYSTGGGGGSSGVATVTAGAGVALTGTAANPIINVIPQPAKNVVYVSNLGADTTTTPQNPVTPYQTIAAAISGAYALQAAAGGSPLGIWNVVCLDASIFSETGSLSLPPNIGLYAPMAAFAYTNGASFPNGVNVLIGSYQTSGNSTPTIYESSISSVYGNYQIGKMIFSSFTGSFALVDSCVATPNNENVVTIGTIKILDAANNNFEGFFANVGNSDDDVSIGQVIWTGTTTNAVASLAFGSSNGNVNLKIGKANIPNLNIVSNVGTGKIFIHCGYINALNAFYVTDGYGQSYSSIDGWIDCPNFGYVNGPNVVSLSGINYSTINPPTVTAHPAIFWTSNGRIHWDSEEYDAPPGNLQDIMSIGPGLALSNISGGVRQISATGNFGVGYASTMEPAAASANVSIDTGSSTNWVAIGTVLVPEGAMTLTTASELAMIVPQPVNGASYMLAIYAFGSGAPYQLVASSAVQTMPSSNSWLYATLSNIVTASLSVAGKYFAVLLWNGNGATAVGVNGQNTGAEPYLSWYKANMGILAAAPATITPDGERPYHLFMRVKQ
jgi:hypothetical protein